MISEGTNTLQDRDSKLPAPRIKSVASKWMPIASPNRPLNLISGETLSEASLCFETYGNLNRKRDNAILLFHALTGSQHAARFNPAVEGVGDLWTKDCQTGWWDRFIGPGRALDTDNYFIICANYLGGCYGSTGPTSVNPETSEPYGSRFPRIGFSDIVDSQIRLLENLGIGKLHAVVGSSTGGLLSLNLAVRYAQRVRNVIPIATGLETTPLQKIQIFEQIYAIETDTNFAGGNYYQGNRPSSGMAHARIISHKTFIATDIIEKRVKPNDHNSAQSLGWYRFNHPLESYMLHQGQKFARRFDANSYLRILDAWSSFNLLFELNANDYGELLSRCGNQRHLVFSIDSDSCFPPVEQERLEKQLKQANVPVAHIPVRSEKGHDSFLLEPELYAPHIRHTLDAANLF